MSYMRSALLHSALLLKVVRSTTTALAARSCSERVTGPAPPRYSDEQDTEDPWSSGEEKEDEEDEDGEA